MTAGGIAAAAGADAATAARGSHPRLQVGLPRPLVLTRRPQRGQPTTAGGIAEATGACAATAAGAGPRPQMGRPRAMTAAGGRPTTAGEIAAATGACVATAAGAGPRSAGGPAPNLRRGGPV